MTVPREPWIDAAKSEQQKRLADRYIRPMIEYSSWRFEWAMMEKMRTEVPRILPFGPWVQGAL